MVPSFCCASVLTRAYSAAFVIHDESIPEDRSVVESSVVDSEEGKARGLRIGPSRSHSQGFYKAVVITCERDLHEEAVGIPEIDRRAAGIGLIRISRFGIWKLAVDFGAFDAERTFASIFSPAYSLLWRRLFEAESFVAGSKANPAGG
jgi:hypothetical protein